MVTHEISCLAGEFILEIVFYFVQEMLNFKTRKSQLLSLSWNSSQLSTWAHNYHYYLLKCCQLFSHLIWFFKQVKESANIFYKDKRSRNCVTFNARLITNFGNFVFGFFVILVCVIFFTLNFCSACLALLNKKVNKLKPNNCC